VLHCLFGLLKPSMIFIILIIPVCFVTFQLFTFRYEQKNSIKKNGD